jgi:transcriptional regulator with XRE-family HTH domain
MTPTEIKVELLRKGITQADIARRLGISPAAVNNAIHRRGGIVTERVMRGIAEALDRDPAAVFPEYFLKKAIGG